MKKYLQTCLVLLLIPFVLAQSPPAIPMEIWGEASMDGSPVPDGLAVKAMVDGTDYAQSSVTNDGYYDVLLVNGDRPLTYNDDPDCSSHWQAGEACVTCTPGVGPDKCIEGPADNDDVTIYIDDKVTIPIITWNQGEILRQDLIVVTDGIINFSITLVDGWNLISLPLVPVDSDISVIMDGCDYNKIWGFEPDQSWKSTDSGLVSLDVLHGYWIDRNGLSGNCEITVSGSLPKSTTQNMYAPWTLVGYPSLTSKPIDTIFSGVSYNKIWAFEPDQSWKSTDSGLTHLEPGRGYWIDSSDDDSYIITN